MSAFTVVLVEFFQSSFNLPQHSERRQEFHVPTGADYISLLQE
jgi:hypothetical protein